MNLESIITKLGMNLESIITKLGINLVIRRFETGSKQAQASPVTDNA